MSPRRSAPARMLALDLDGTLLRDDKTISDFTLATLCRAQAAGLYIAFVTGRRERIAAPVFQLINFPAWAVLNNGPIAMHLPGGERLVTRYISPQVVHHVIACLRTVNRPPVIVIDPQSPFSKGGTGDFKSANVETSLFGNPAPTSNVERPTSYIDLVIDRALLSIPLYEEYARRHAGFISIADDIAASPLINRAAGMFLCEPTEAIEPLRAHLDTTLGERVEHRALDNLDYFPDHRVLEVVQPGLTKWNGIEFLLAALGIEDAEVFAFGDDHNDLDMLSAAHMSFAPANAIPAAQQAADRIIPSNNTDGVAITIRSLFPDVFE